ncbi:MAG: helix-turn-helix transcriptional regulator [Ruminococcaceae bacterium]|nr:helix-turn-helix transcriptional regulator [Oscillospiraceae bacterium]
MLYKRIRELRKERFLTQMQIAEVLKCSQRVYSNYECGELDIPTDVLIKLADFHKISIDYLLNRTDKKN